MYRRQSSLDVATDNRRDFLCIVQNELIGDSHGNTLFTTVDCPDQSTVRRIKLLYSGLLFDHFRTVQTESRFRRHHDVARKPRRQGHAAETSDGARDYGDDWSMLPQPQDGRHHFGDSIESQVGFLQAHAACFEQQDRDRFLTVLRISSCEIECGRHLGARDLAHAARLEPSLSAMTTAALPAIAPLRTTQPSSNCGAMPCSGNQGDSIRSNGPTSSRQEPGSIRLCARALASSSIKLCRRTNSGITVA